MYTVFHVAGDAEHTECGASPAGTTQEIRDLRTREDTSQTE